jgi:hypothetical protein
VVVAVVCSAIVAVTLGAGLVGGSSLLMWGSRFNEGRVGAHLWDATVEVASRLRLIGLGFVVLGAMGLGPFLWVVAVV